jgi:hypothetical protein
MSRPRRAGLLLSVVLGAGMWQGGATPVPTGAEGHGRASDPDLAQATRRPVPAGLTPRLGRAFEDKPASYRSGCHNIAADERLRPCVYGDRRGRLRITLYGDSHAAQWLPALARAGRARGWRITSLTKSACPSAHVRFDHSAYLGNVAHCRRWRARAERWIANHDQDLVVITNWEGYRLLGRDGRALAGAAADGAWRRGMAAVLTALPDTTSALVLGDIPTPGRDIPRCLRSHRANLGACDRSRKRSTRGLRTSAGRRAAAARGATFRSTIGLICPSSPCPLIAGRVLMWRDDKHLTATYARRLAPAMRRWVREALSG